ncbi:MAG: hypothetical protein IJX69_06160 [Oscillospiraceae bacterium]|nr:hypothetical protein [Oscillospiraceae bacterium]
MLHNWLQECLETVRRRETAFLSIRASLTEEQKEALDACIAACEELTYCQGMTDREGPFFREPPDSCG